MKTDVINTFKVLSTFLRNETKDILDSYGLFFCTIRRSYDDGSMIWIMNDESYLTGYFDNKIPLPKAFSGVPNQNEPSQGVCFTDDLPPLQRSYYIEEHNLFGGLGLFTRKDSFCDFMAFSFKKQCLIRPFSCYANIMPQLRHFKEEFFKKHDAFLTELYQKNKVLKLVKEEPLSMNALTVALRKDFPFPQKKSHQDITLSSDEFILFSLLKKNNTQYDIQHVMNMGPHAFDLLLGRVLTKIDAPLYKILLFDQKKSL